MHFFVFFKLLLLQKSDFHENTEKIEITRQSTSGNTEGMLFLRAEHPHM